MNIASIGTDICSDWSFNEKGDLNIVSNEDNIKQAIINRLSCELNSLNLFYLNYGSALFSFIGWKRLERTLEFIKIEVENRLIQDPRLNEFSVDVSYIEDGKIRLDIDVVLSEDEDYSESFVITKDGVDLIGNR